MSVNPSDYKEKLNTAITEAIKSFRETIDTSKGAFSRERVLPLPVMVKTMLAMGGGTFSPPTT